MIPLIPYKRIKYHWSLTWMRLSGISFLGRLASRLARIPMPPYFGCVPLAKLHSHGYISPTAIIHHDALERGKNCFIGDNVIIYQDNDGGFVKLGGHVHLHTGIKIQTGNGANVEIGEQTHIQPGCQLSAYKSSIKIGRGVEIAPNCAFYSYNHSVKAGQPIRNQPLDSKGDISIGDNVWLGYGVIVLDGVVIGKNTVIGAGSVVTKNIPQNAIAAGNPAKLIKFRS